MEFHTFAQDYLERLTSSFDKETYKSVSLLARDLLDAWSSKSSVYICGNGGSAANAIHMANDFIYGVGACTEPEITVPGLNVEAITANSGVITCLANDTGYENIFSAQLRAKATEKDILIVLSGSGNSANVVNALETANTLGMKTWAIVGYSGGKCLNKAHQCIHFKVDDMQIAEDTQLIVGHLCMQWLEKHKVGVKR